MLHSSIATPLRSWCQVGKPCAASTGPTRCNSANAGDRPSTAPIPQAIMDFVKRFIAISRCIDCQLGRATNFTASGSKVSLERSGRPPLLFTATSWPAAPDSAQPVFGLKLTARSTCAQPPKVGEYTQTRQAGSPPVQSHRSRKHRQPAPTCQDTQAQLRPLLPSAHYSRLTARWPRTRSCSCLALRDVRPRRSPQSCPVPARGPRATLARGADHVPAPIALTATTAWSAVTPALLSKV